MVFSKTQLIITFTVVQTLPVRRETLDKRWGGYGQGLYFYNESKIIRTKKM